MCVPAAQLWAGAGPGTSCGGDEVYECARPQIRFRDYEGCSGPIFVFIFSFDSYFPQLSKSAFKYSQQGKVCGSSFKDKNCLDGGHCTFLDVHNLCTVS